MSSNNTSINYIIATHALAYKKRIDTDHYSQYVLRYHMYILSQILTKESNIKQITIVQPDVVDDLGYYYNLSPYDKQIEDLGIKIEYLKVENKGISYTQYMKAFQTFPDFDYYIIMEDDWTINTKYINFDKCLLDLYNKTFTNNIGFLDCWSPNKGKFVGSNGGRAEYKFHSAITLGLLSQTTMQTHLSNILHKLNNLIQYEFSLDLLKICNICDLNSAGFKSRILFWDTPDGVIKDYTEDDENMNEAFYVPVQYYYDVISYKNMLTNNIYTVENKDIHIHDK